jgi:hypothetical protein
MTGPIIAMRTIGKLVADCTSSPYGNAVTVSRFARSS